MGPQVVQPALTAPNTNAVSKFLIANEELSARKIIFRLQDADKLVG